MPDLSEAVTLVKPSSRYSKEDYQLASYRESGGTVAVAFTQVDILNTLVPAVYDYTSLSYTGSNLTGVVFKTGGSGGTTVATLSLAYDGSNNLTSVTKV